MAETAFRQSMLLSGGNVGIFFGNGLVGSIMGLALVILCWPLLGKVKSWLRRRENAAHAA